MTLKKIVGFFTSNAVWFAVLAGFLGTVATWDRMRIKRAEKRGAAEVVSTANNKAKELAHEAVQHRAAARRPGAVDRLRKREHCRDC